MSNEHYFAPSPESELKLRTIHARLAGRVYEVQTANGIFSPEHIDTGTQVLLANVPAPPPGGNVLDLGCGWGPIALTLALESPRSTVWAVDVNERALDLVRRNAEIVGVSNIWSNPPIRVGKNELHGLLEKWLPRLDNNSDGWLVVQRNLGSDSLHRWMQATFPDDFTFVRTATNKGYRVLRARKR
jgi:16S rRNA (guanine1207-N2)-methyltransferase